MKIAISGTYSSGKTTTSIALARLTGVPRTHAKTMREILPEALPGKRLEDCTSAELIQLLIRRYGERVRHESHLPEGFISDGSALHEWVYGTIRTLVGIHPDDAEPLPTEHTPEMKYFEEVMVNIGSVVKHHAKHSYDVFVHLPVEFPLAADGHRPVSERFRKLSDELLLDVLDELEIPYHVVGGTIPERLTKITEILGLPRVLGVDEAIGAALAEVAAMDTADEVSRVPQPARSGDVR